MDDLRGLLTAYAADHVTQLGTMPASLRRRARLHRLFVVLTSFVSLVAISAAGVGIARRLSEPVTPTTDAPWKIVRLPVGSPSALAGDPLRLFVAAGRDLVAIDDREGSGIWPRPVGTELGESRSIRDLQIRNGVALVSSSGYCSSAKSECSAVEGVDGRGRRVLYSTYPSADVRVAAGASRTWAALHGTVSSIPALTRTNQLRILTPADRRKIEAIVDGTRGPIVAVTDGASTELIAMESHTQRAIARAHVGAVRVMRWAHGTLWVAHVRGGDAMLTQFAEGMRVVRSTPLPFGDPVGLAFYGTEVFVGAATREGGAVHRIDIRQSRDDRAIVRSLRTNGRPADVAVAFHSLWVAHARPARLARVDLDRPAPRPSKIGSHLTRVDEVRIHADGRTIDIHYLGGRVPCGALDHVEVVFTPDAIRIAAVTGDDFPPGQPYGCRLVGVGAQTTVRLREPIRGRPFVSFDGDEVRTSRA